MEHAKGKWIYTGNTYQNQKDPIFYHANIICGGKRVAKVAGIGENETMANAYRICYCVNNFDSLLNEKNQLRASLETANSTRDKVNSS